MRYGNNEMRLDVKQTNKTERIKVNVRKEENERNRYDENCPASQWQE